MLKRTCAVVLALFMVTAMVSAALGGRAGTGMGNDIGSVGGGRGAPPRSDYFYDRTVNAVAECNATPGFTLTPEQKQGLKKIRDDYLAAQVKWRADTADEVRNAAGDMRKLEAIGKTKPKLTQVVPSIRSLLRPDQLRAVVAKENAWQRTARPPGVPISLPTPQLVSVVVECNVEPGFVLTEEQKTGLKEIRDDLRAAQLKWWEENLAAYQKTLEEVRAAMKADEEARTFRGTDVGAGAGARKKEHELMATQPSLDKANAQVKALLTADQLKATEANIAELQAARAGR